MVNRTEVAPHDSSGPSVERHSPLPSIALPKGGGAVRSIGEKFAVNAATGTGSLSVPVAVSAGRSGFGPQLALSYDSGAGNGPFGFGWSLSLPAITRKTDKGLPRYLDDDDSDEFLLGGAEDLVPVLDGAGARVAFDRTVHGVDYRVRPYRPRIEGLFARIERWTQTGGADNGVSHWRTITRDNVTTLYGIDVETRIVDPRSSRRIFSYLIALSFDDKGNATRYEYRPDDADGVDTTAAHESNRPAADRRTQRYAARILYGNVSPYFPSWTVGGAPTPLPAAWHFQVVFDYGDHRTSAPTPVRDALLDPAWPVRPDPYSAYRAGFEVRTYRRCERVLLFHEFAGETGFETPCLVRSTDFQYSDESAPNDPRNPSYTFLEAVTQCGYKRAGVGGYLRRTSPPLEFFYSDASIDATILSLDPASSANLPEGIDGGRFQPVDLDGEGLTGLLTEQDGAWGYKRNLSPLNQVTLPNGSQVARARFGPIERVPTLPVPANLGGGQQLVDLTGEGRPDLVAFDATVPGYFARTADHGWETLQPFRSLPRLHWSEPNLKFVDLTGDGRADVLVTDAEAYTLHESLGVDGFTEAHTIPTPSDERQGPRVVFADGTHTISLADMTGDGLSDIVRVRTGEVCYWPNLGYGRFGPMVTMDASPRFASEDMFDPRRVRFADIDGSGTTDLLYLGHDGVHVCFNRSGNAWAAPQLLAVFPGSDDLVSVQTMDLLGNGTSCLVWSSALPGEAARPLRYVDLMGSRKPHLLVRFRNNLGAETRLSYAPSTRFYLEDANAGRPWITRLPFPVQTVERVESYDWIGRSRHVTRYAYHHGFFDGEEREFRGFGMVESWDTEAHRDDTLFPDVAAANEDALSHVPPVRTRSWFHTGAFLEARVVSQQYAREYWNDPAATLLPDTVIDGVVDVAELREAYRALKGSALRVELFADDGSALADRPYTVTESTFAVRREQPRGPNRHAIFLAHPAESISYHYERQPDDPRIAHDVTLDVDAFGNARRTIAVVYPRRVGHPDPEPTLSAEFRTMLAHDQSRLRVAATEQLHTAPVHTPWEAAQFDAYRAPLPCETITAELTAITPVATRFTSAELDAHWSTLWDGAHDVNYEDVSTPDIEGTGVPMIAGRRIVGHARTLYRADDLSALLAAGTAQSRALAGESYRLAFTPGLVTRIFGARVTDAILIEGGYMKLGANPNWWAPSGRVFLSINAAHTAAQELAEATAHFYLPRRAVDVFGSTTLVTYDAHDLLPVASTDAVGNVITAENDYRVLGSFRSTDPNGNRAEVAFDCLGQVVGTAAMGKVAQAVGDSLAAFNADLDDATVQAALANPFGSPALLLGDATSRVIYDIFAYQRTRSLAQPSAPVVYTLTRETHASDLAPGATTAIHHAFEYSDGFGRDIQHMAQAETGPVPGVGANVSPRWVASGWTVNDSKGRPVRKFEPFFTDSHRFAFDARAGVSTVLFYDPMDRVVGSLHPDATWEKTVFDAWRQETWDTNDTVGIADARTDSVVGDFVRRLVGTLPGAFVSWHDQRSAGTLGATAAERLANQDAAAKALAHAGTPTVAHADTLGRPCVTVVDEGTVAGVARRRASRSAMDTHSKPLAIFDALGRRVVEFCLREPLPGGGAGFRYVAGYDLIGNPLCPTSMDSGQRLTLNDAVGKPLRAWDARGFASRSRYDALHRPTHRYVAPAVGAEQLVERLVYGEQHADSSLNLRGQLFRHYDGAGVASNDAYDFKGNLLSSGRHLARHVPAQDIDPDPLLQGPDWSSIANVADQPTLDVAALDLATSGSLEPAGPYVASSRYDAMNRTVQIVTPHAAVAPANRPSVIQPAYNAANLLERIDVWVRRAAPPAALLDPNDAALPPDARAVTDVSYNARGERTRIAFGNGAVTTYDYDPATFRLVALTTTRPHVDPDARVVQALSYHYDPVGNVTRLRDDADLQDVVFFRNQRVEPTTDYRYDALYRLTAATGREQLGLTLGALNAPAQPTHDDSARRGLAAPSARGDGNALATYTETYAYDVVGNLTAMIHQVATGTWTRRYAYEAPSRISAAETGNRVTSTSLPGDAAAGPYSATYDYDAHGQATRMPHLPRMTWDVDERLQSTTRQRLLAGTPSTTYYTYDAAGSRVRKLTYAEANAGATPVLTSERIYLGALEIYREYDAAGAVSLERESLHVLIEQQRVALVETRTLGVGGVAGALLRYHLGNHLGSVAIELDATAALISYEEYFPFGSTSYQGVRDALETPNRYRYTGKERDEENDLGYHGARYYAPWLGRWISPDPAGLVDGVNLYAYVRNNPIRLSDPTGRLSWGQWAGIAAAVVVGTVVTVATAGLAGPLVGAAAATVIGGIVGGAVGAGVGEAVEARIDHRESHIVRAMVIGGVTGGLLAGAGVAAGSLLRTAAGQAVASRVASSAVGQVASSVARRVGQSVVGRGLGRAGQLLREPAERLGQRISQSLGMGASARATAAAQARAVAGQVNAQNAAGVTRTVSSAGDRTFTHSVGWRGGGTFGPDVTGAQVEAASALQLTPSGIRGQWGEGAYAFEGTLTPGQTGTAFQFRVPPQTAVESVMVPGSQNPIIRLVAPPGQSVVPIRITGNNFGEGALEAGRDFIRQAGFPQSASRFGYPGISPDVTGLSGGLGAGGTQVGNILWGPGPNGGAPQQSPGVSVSF